MVLVIVMVESSDLVSLKATKLTFEKLFNAYSSFHFPRLTFWTIQCYAQAMIVWFQNYRLFAFVARILLFMFDL